MQTIRDNAVRMLMEGYSPEQIRGFLEILSKMPECECDQLRTNLTLEKARLADAKEQIARLEETLDAFRQGTQFTTRLLEERDREIAELRGRLGELTQMQVCPECNGDGWTIVAVPGRNGDPEPRQEQCETCGSEGEIPTLALRYTELKDHVSMLEAIVKRVTAYYTGKDEKVAFLYGDDQLLKDACAAVGMEV